MEVQRWSICWWKKTRFGSKINCFDQKNVFLIKKTVFWSKKRVCSYKKAFWIKKHCFCLKKLVFCWTSRFWSKKTLFWSKHIFFNQKNAFEAIKNPNIKHVFWSKKMVWDWKINDLIKNKQIEIDYVANLVPRLFCRKLYNYSYEVVDEF